MELSNSNTKKTLIFLKRNLFIYVGKQKPPKNFLFFMERNFLIFQETETLKISYISGSNFPSLKKEKKTALKKFLIFQEMDLSSLKTNNSLIFQERT